MKKYLFLFFLMCTGLTALAQQGRPFYVYTAKGLEDIFYTSQVRKFSYAPIDEDHPDQYNQVIGVYRGGTKVPVAEIDSVSFLTPALSVFQQEGKVNHISSEAFRQLVIDYKAAPEDQKMLGERPVIIDCWAKWCTYCLQMMPIMEQLAEEYKGRIDFYKVDTDEEPELSKFLDSYSLPCLYFYPKKGQPVVHEGLMDLSSIRDVIEKFLLVTDDENPDAEKPAVELNLWKGDINHAWTDRRFTANITCTSKNATLVKYGCFRKIDIENTPLSERELIQRYGDVLSADYLPKVNSAQGMPVTFKADKGTDYLFLCLVKTAEGGVTVESAEISTDATYTPLMDFQVRSGALAEFIQPGKNHMTVYMKTLEAVEAAYGYLQKSEFDQALAAGETIESLLAGEGDHIIRLTPEELQTANGMGYSHVIVPLQEMTDYICFARVRNAEGKVMVDQEDLRTPYAGYNETIPSPDLKLFTSLIGTSVSCSVNCATSDAVYTSLLMLPADEVTRALAEGQTLESLMKTHPKVSTMTEQQLEWVNDQGVSNVLSNVQPDTRYTCIAEAYGRYGGHVVVRSDIQTLPQGMASLPLDIMISGSFSQHMMMASAVCRSANAVSAAVALIESDKLEQLLASGAGLEALMDKQSSDFLKYETFTEDQMNWFNLNGFVLAYDNAKPSTRYTWILDARMADGFRRVQRTELVTPSQAEQDYLSLQATRSAADKTPAALPLQQVIRMK